MSETELIEQVLGTVPCATRGVMVEHDGGPAMLVDIAPDAMPLTRSIVAAAWGVSPDVMGQRIGLLLPGDNDTIVAQAERFAERFHLCQNTFTKGNA